MRKILIGLVLLVLVLAGAGMALAEETITANTPTTVDITIPGDVVMYQFTPTQNGLYMFYSSNNDEDEWVDAYGYLLDSEKQMIIKDDDSGEGNHFKFVRRLTANRTYYFAASFYGTGTTGSFRIEMDRLDGLYAEAVNSVTYSRPGVPGTAEVEAYSLSGGLTYQWYDGSTAIAGATKKAYHFPALTQAKTYRCVVTDGAGQSKEVTVEARIDSGLTLRVTDPKATYGGDVTVTVTATAVYGQDQLTYQWFEQSRNEDGFWEDAVPIDGETNPTITLTNVTRCRQLMCRVTDINGNYQQCWSWITIEGENTGIGLSPAGDWGEDEFEKTVAAGSTVTMAVTVETGYEPVRYYWNKVHYDSWGDYYWERIPGENGASLTLTNVTESATYACEVINAIGESDGINFRVKVPGGEFHLAEAEEENTINITTGETATLTVTPVDAAGTVKYQWYYHDPMFDREIPIRGATSASYQLSGNVKSGSYRCRATDGKGNEDSAWFTVWVESTFSAQADTERQLSLTPGSTATMKVITTGANVSYRWYDSTYSKDNQYYNEGELIEGQETDSLTITADGRHRYTCAAFDPYGHRAEITFEVLISNNFTVSVTKTNFTVNAGDSVTLNATGSCTTGDITYRWTKNSRTVKESTDPFLTIDAVGADTYGQYWLFAYDEYGNSREFDFRISVENHFSASAENDGQITIDPGEDVTLTVNAQYDAGTLTYSWYGKSTRGDWYDVISGETQATLALTNVQKACNYFCEVEDQFGGSKDVWFYITIKNELTAGPLNGKNNFTVNPGDPVTMAVDASCQNGGLTYQWYKDEDYTYWKENPIGGATKASYAIEAVSKAGEYVCEVKDAYENTANVWFYLRINNEMRVEALDGEYTFYIIPGESLILTTVASCKTGSLTYQWYKQIQTGEDSWSNEKLYDETGTSYTTGPISERTDYYCEVKDEYGNNSSAWFHVYIDNGLTVVPNGSRTKTAEVGDDVLLGVTATCNEGGLTFQWAEGYKTYSSSGSGDWWWDYDDIDGANEATYTVEDVSIRTSYRCIVKDELGGRKEIYFTIQINNGLDAGAAGEYSRYIPIGGTATLTTAARCDHGGVHYQWIKQIEYIEDGNHYWMETLIPGATAASYTTAPVTAADREVQYGCRVTDDYDNSTTVWYTVYADSALTAEPDGNNLFHASDAPITMAVSASNAFQDDEFTYEWYDNYYNRIYGETESTLTLANPEGGSYHCDVKDGCRTKRVWFFITDGPFAQIYMDGDSTVNRGEQVTLRVAAWNEENDITYQWYEYNDNGEYEPIDGATGATYTFTVNGYKELYCHVTGTGINTSMGYDVYVQRNWSVSYGGMSRINIIPAGGSIQLKLNINKTDDEVLTCKWTKDGQEILGQASETLTVTEDGLYHVRITDQYNNSWSDTFYCLSQPETLSEGQTVTGPEEGGPNIYQIIPAKTGQYEMEAVNGWIPIYRAGETGSFTSVSSETKEVRLEKGKTYFVMLDYTYETFKYTLVTEEQEEYSIILPKGQKVWIPYSLYLNGSYKYFDYATSSDQSVIRITNERKLEFKNEGTATITACYDGEIIRVYHITVTTGNTLTMPAGLRTIEEDAFNGDTSAKFIRLGENVERVRKGAFANIGSICVFVENRDTEIDSGAFSRTNAVVICEDGNAAWCCRNSGTPYFLTQNN